MRQHTPNSDCALVLCLLSDIVGPPLLYAQTRVQTKYFAAFTTGWDGLRPGPMQVVSGIRSAAGPVGRARCQRFVPTRPSATAVGRIWAAWAIPVPLLDRVAMALWVDPGDSGGMGPDSGGSMSN